MSRTYRIILPGFLTLMLVLHCTQMCFRAASIDISALTQTAEPQSPPCHTSDTPAPEAPSECSSCSSVVFLDSTRLPLKLPTAAAHAFPSSDLFMQTAYHYGLSSRDRIHQRHLPPLSSPDYIVFSRLLL